MFLIRVARRKREKIVVRENKKEMEWIEKVEEGFEESRRRKGSENASRIGKQRTNENQIKKDIGMKRSMNRDLGDQIS